MSTPDPHVIGFITHRAIVRAANPTTGICFVEIPEWTGANEMIEVSNVGLSIVEGSYNTPTLGSSVFVASNRISNKVFFIAEPFNPAVSVPIDSYTAADVLAKIKTVDGSGSGLDADTLDGFDSSYFLSASSYNPADVLAKVKTVDGDGSGLDADTLDGYHASSFLQAGASSGFLPVGAAHSITLGGDLNGSVTISNSASGNYLLTATVVADAVALGTDTTGNYVAAITGAANGITVTGSGVEGASVGLALPQALHTAASPSFVQVTSTAASGTPPFQVASTTLVPNLNANYLGGDASSAFLRNSASHSITLSGDLAGSVTVTNLASGNYTINATIGTDSVALGTDTTGSYVAAITGSANGITVTGSGVEGASVGLALPQALHTAASPSFSQVTSTVATGTPPFQVASTTMVPNLNANYLGGNASSSFLLTSASHSITLGGDLTGSVTLTNLSSGNYTLNASVNAESVALGTDTTGNYVGSVTTNEVNGIAISGSGVENAAVVLTLPQPLSSTATPTFSRLITTASAGTPPFQVTSTAMVPNLNSNFLGGSAGSAFVAATAYTDAALKTKIQGLVLGAGSGIDADLLDGLDSSAFLSASSYTAADVLSKIKTVDGNGSGLDADLLDSKDSVYFAAQASLEAVLGDLMYVGLYNPTNYAITNRSLAASVATITASAPHGYSVGNVVGVRVGKKTVTTMARTGNSATLTTEVAHGLIVGQKVFVDGVSNTALNGTWLITGVTTLTVTFTTATSGTITSTATTGYVAPAAFWGQAFTVTAISGASANAFSYSFADPNITTAATDGATFRMPVPIWSGSVGASAGASTTYRHSMYWIVASEGLADFVDADLSGRQDWNEAQSILRKGDWVIAINPANNPAFPQTDLPLSAITFQMITFSTDTFVDGKISDHMANANDPHGPAGYTTRGVGVTYPPVGISTVARNGTTATITTTSPHGFAAGTSVLINNVGNSFDGTFAVNGASTSTFTFLSGAASFPVTAASAGLVGAVDTRRNVDQVFSRLEHNHTTDIQNAINVHAAAADPHSVYLTQPEADLLYPAKEHNHNSLYEVIGAVAQHQLTFDHSKFLSTAQTDSLYFPLTGNFDDRYYLKSLVDAKIAALKSQVFSSDGGQSARIFMGSTQPASAGLIRGDLWIETPNLDLQVPIAPSGLTTSVTSSSVTLNWTAWSAATAVSALTLLRATNAGFTGATTLTVSPSSLVTYTDTGLSENTNYYYRLSATNAAGVGPTLDTPATLTLNGAPPPPQTPVAVTVASTTNLSLSWTAPSGAFADPAANRYRVYLNGALVTSASVSPYVFTGLAESTSYTLGVQSIDTAGLTSSVVSAAPISTLNIAPPTPSGAASAGVAGNQITLSWNAVTVADFSTYKAYLYLTSQPPPTIPTIGSPAALVTTASTSCTFTAPAYSTGYTLRVYAMDTAGNTSTSAAVTTATSGPAPDVIPPPPATITSFKPVGSYGVMVVEATCPASDFASYTVQRSTDGTTWADDGAINVSAAVNSTFTRTLNGNTAYAAPTTVYVRVNTKDAAGNVTVGSAQSYSLVASPINIVADSTNSWRNTNGGEYNQPANYRPYQGYFSNSAYNAMGFWYYGTNPYSNLYNSGRRTVTGGTFLLIRADAGSSAAMTPVLAMHDYTASPGTVTGQGTPTLYYTGQSAGVSVTTPAGGSNLASASLPFQWVQDLADGTRRGIAVYAPTTPVYANFYSVAENAYSGLLQISHLG